MNGDAANGNTTYLHRFYLGNRRNRTRSSYLEFYRQGRLKLDEMISKRGRLDDINEAFRAMKAGEVARTVLMFD